MTLGADDRLALVAEAARAPSAHNAQPARWRFLSGDRVALFEDTRRRLSVGDPENRDGRVGLGAAFEGMHLALSGRGLALGAPRLASTSDDSDTFAVAPAPHLEPVAEAGFTAAAGEDPLAAWVDRRHTYRGAFLAARPGTGSGSAAALRRVLDAHDVAIVDRPGDLAALARLHDRCTVEAMAAPAYRRELWDWLRLSPGHPDWDRDGLSGDCLALSRVERALGRIAMRPAVYGALAGLGLGRLVVSEAPAIGSATAVAVLHRPAGEDPFHAGRRLYRLWLEVAREGFHLCPMSATADSPAGVAHLRERLGLPADRRVINVLRIGIAPADEAVGVSRRLPPEELLV